MVSLIDQAFRKWAGDKSRREARVAIFEKIRDIPYAVIPNLISVDRYTDILTIRRGSCSPKHFLLCDLFERLNTPVLYAVYPFRWADVEVDYPPRLRRMAQALPVSSHLACRAEIGSRLVLLDATVDLALEVIGLPVNKGWDGISDTLLPVEPLAPEQLYHPLEARYINASVDKAHLAFYEELNRWLETIRKGHFG